ncbi:MAG: MotA/TolQ/ExbB proton channel family protein [Oscillospiraceae bacterium]|nr:MotA/TolQ/ExbB proton channel family protein [Oscillospiraceae bacterium]
MFKLGFAIFLVTIMITIIILGGTPIHYIDPASIMIILLPLVAVLTATRSFRVFLCGWRAAWNPREEITEEMRGQAASLFRFLSKIAMMAGVLGTLISLINMLMNLDFADEGGIAALSINLAASLLTVFYSMVLIAAVFEPIVFVLKKRSAKRERE